MEPGDETAKGSRKGGAGSTRTQEGQTPRACGLRARPGNPPRPRAALRVMPWSSLMDLILPVPFPSSLFPVVFLSFLFFSQVPFCPECPSHQALFPSTRTYTTAHPQEGRREQHLMPLNRIARKLFPPKGLSDPLKSQEENNNLEAGCLYHPLIFPLTKRAAKGFRHKGRYILLTFY